MSFSEDSFSKVSPFEMGSIQKSRGEISPSEVGPIEDVHREVCISKIKPCISICLSPSIPSFCTMVKDFDVFLIRHMLGSLVF